MKRLAALTLVLATNAHGHYQHIKDSDRRILTDLTVAPVPVTITNTADKQHTYHVSVNGEYIGIPVVIGANSKRTITAYLTMPEDGANKVQKKELCSHSIAEEGETLTTVVCHKIQVFYAR